MDPLPLISRLADSVLTQLRSKLNTLAAAQERRLPPERTLAAELRVSRRVVRQALAILEAEGMIQRTRGRGTVITTTAKRAAFGDGSDNLKQYTSPAELMETRLALEPAIAALSATHASSQDLEDMHEYLLRGSRATDPETWERWDGALHRTIGHSTYNAMLIRFSDMLDDARAQTAWGHLRRASLNGPRQQLYTQQHQAILAAIADRNPGEASRAMRRHLITVRRTLIDQTGDDFADEPPDAPEPPTR